jgi:alanyl-tRNA synthetase
MRSRLKALENKIEQLQGELASGGNGEGPEEKIQLVGDVRLLTTRHDGVEAKGLRVMLDRLRDKLGSGVVVVGGVHKGKASILAGVTSDLVETCHAGKLVAALAPIVGGKGGGKADMAQGGGTDINSLDQALAAVAEKLTDAR